MFRQECEQFDKMGIYYSVILVSIAWWLHAIILTNAEKL